MLINAIALSVLILVMVGSVSLHNWLCRNKAVAEAAASIPLAYFQTCPVPKESSDSLGKRAGTAEFSPMGCVCLTECVFCKAVRTTAGNPVDDHMSPA